MNFEQAKPRNEKACSVCGKTFHPRNHSYVTCSQECKAENKRRQKYACYLKRKSKPESKCCVCGKTYAKKNGILTCSDECRKKKIDDYKKKMWAGKSSKNKKEIKPLLAIIDAYRDKTGDTYTNILTKKLKVSAGLISDWKCGKCLPSPEVQKKIKALLK